MLTYNLEHCVWETTLRCNLKCRHCGSKAGKARGKELSFHEAANMFSQLALLGCKRVIMSGGEPLLRPDILKLALEIQKCGMKACLITNGLAVPKNIKLIEQMNLYSIAISLDGLRPTHNFLRDNQNSYDCVLQSLQLLHSLFVDLYVITQVNKHNLSDLESLYQLLLGYELDGWQIQLTNDMGRAEDLKNTMLDKDEIRQVLDFILAKQTGSLKIYPADDLGYYYQNSFCFGGCQAGISVIGIEANGMVKPCLSMQKDTRFDGGNIRERSLLDIWQDPAFALINRQERHFKGQCASCQHLKKCRGGCVGTALAFDALTEYPFCIRAS